MTEQRESSELAKAVVLAAVNAAGPAGNNTASWRAKIRDDYVPMIAAMVRQGAPLPRLADDIFSSFVFAGEIVKLELEETSKRGIVTFRSETTSKTDANDDGTEHIRTHRTDTGYGRTQWKRLTEAGVGAKILLYKTMEATDVKGREVRVLSHFEVLSTGTQAEAPPRSAQASPVASQDAPTSGGADKLMDRLNHLPGPAAGRVVKTYRATGRTFPPTKPEDRAALEQLINEEEP